MTNTKLLNELIQQSGLKKNHIAKELGISPFALAKKIRNENEFKSSEILKLCELLQISSLKQRELIFFTAR